MEKILQRIINELLFKHRKQKIYKLLTITTNQNDKRIDFLNYEIVLYSEIKKDIKIIFWNDHHHFFSNLILLEKEIFVLNKY